MTLKYLEEINMVDHEDFQFISLHLQIDTAIPLQLSSLKAAENCT